MAVVKGLDDFVLVDRHIERAADANVVERLGVRAHDERIAVDVGPLIVFDLRRGLLQVLYALPADRFEDVELAGLEGGEAGRVVLDDAIGNGIDQRQLYLVAVDGVAVPVFLVLRVDLRIARHVTGNHERAAAGGVLPVAGAGIGHFLRHDRGVVAVAEAIFPVGEVTLEMEGNGVAVERDDLLDVV